MENNSMENNSLMEIKKQYENCNLLLPVASEAQLNPFYKLTVMEVTADVSENSGDVFAVGKVNSGRKDNSGKDIWVETFSPAKPLLMKLAAAAGIQFDPNNTFGTRVSKNVYKAKAFGAVRLPDGTCKTHCDEKVIDLEDEEDRFRLEFMDKSIEGITDPKAAKEAAKMFPGGEWIDATNKFDKPCKAYKIPEKDRHSYIERSVMVNMTLLRKTAAEKTMTGAINRVIRALIGMKGQYTKAELQKPFAVSRMAFSPDFNNPEVRRTMLAQGMASMSNMFGSTPMIGLTEHSADTAVIDEFNPEEFADNPAFASDSIDGETTPLTDTDNDEPEISAQKAPPAPAPERAFSHDYADEEDDLICANCSRDISKKVYDFSMKKYDLPLCMKCQGEVGIPA